MTVLLALCPWAAHGADSRQELLRSIGLGKPAFSQAPDFTLYDAAGGLSSLARYRGGFVLLNFWATWCGPCRDEMPSMEQLNRSFGGQGFAVVAVNQRENAAVVDRFMKTQGLNFPAPLDVDGRVAASYRVYGIPVTYLIDGNGQAIGIKSGARDWAAPAVVAAFRKLVGESRGSASGATFRLPPAPPLPGSLRPRADGVILRAQQDAHSEPLGKLDREEEIVPIGRVSGGGEVWYFVNTRRGTGWVRAGEVEEAGKIK